MPSPTSRRLDLKRNYELDRVLLLREAADLMSLSEDTIRRRFADKLVRLSPRRVGLRLRDALMLGDSVA